MMGQQHLVARRHHLTKGKPYHRVVLQATETKYEKLGVVSLPNGTRTKGMTMTWSLG